MSGRPGLEILSLDSGPGTANFSPFMRDGYSTSGTMGTGLGADQRHSSVFEVHSQPGLGTALLSQVWPSGVKLNPSALRAGAVNLPMRNETVSGDSWCFCDGHNGCSRLVIADGLGHGPAAAEASRCASGRAAPGELQSFVTTVRDKGPGIAPHGVRKLGEGRVWVSRERNGSWMR